MRTLLEVYRELADVDAHPQVSAWRAKVALLQARLADRDGTRHHAGRTQRGAVLHSPGAPSGSADSNPRVAWAGCSCRHCGTSDDRPGTQCPADGSLLLSREQGTMRGAQGSAGHSLDPPCHQRPYRAALDLVDGERGACRGREVSDVWLVGRHDCRVARSRDEDGRCIHDVRCAGGGAQRSHVAGQRLVPCDYRHPDRRFLRSRRHEKSVAAEGRRRSGEGHGGGCPSLPGVFLIHLGWLRHQRAPRLADRAYRCSESVHRRGVQAVPCTASVP